MLQAIAGRPAAILDVFLVIFILLLEGPLVFLPRIPILLNFYFVIHNRSNGLHRHLMLLSRLASHITASKCQAANHFFTQGK